MVDTIIGGRIIVVEVAAAAEFDSCPRDGGGNGAIDSYSNDLDRPSMPGTMVGNGDCFCVEPPSTGCGPTPCPRDETKEWQDRDHRSAVMDTISKELVERGWKPLAYDYLDPSRPARSDWGEQLKSVKHPEICVHLTMRDWEDPSQNVVRYIFRYERRGCDTSHLTDLLVFGVHTEAPTVRAEQQAVEEFMEKHQRKQP